MTEEQLKAYNWALNQQYQSVAARYARSLAEYIRQERIEQSNPQPLTGWISVKDRIPEDGLNVLVANIETGTQYVSHKDLIFFDENKSAFVPTSYLREFQFTHWMPLPAPPKEVAHDD